jgi:hypothetical protein
MIPITHYQIFKSTHELPENWYTLAKNNLFLGLPYLQFLEKASPSNFNNYFIGLYAQDQLVGICLAQHVDLRNVNHFGQRDSFLKKAIRGFLFKNFSGKLLIVGNNLMTGASCHQLQSDIDPASAMACLKRMIHEQFKAHIHLCIFKDFREQEASYFPTSDQNTFLTFTAQPNMHLLLRPSWLSFTDYQGDLTKKYRDQCKRARKKGEGVTNRVLEFSDLMDLEDRMHELYLHVAHHAPFNTFFLPKNHFIELKNQLGDQFHMIGHYLDGEFVGFHSMILQGKTVETYFLGYDEQIQREHMLYLNMLYDMIEFGIQQGAERINFGRTAMEIKSSVGAQSEMLFSFMQHSHPIINRNLGFFYQFLEPKVAWTERHPFKT